MPADEVVLPALLRVARGAYAAAIRAELADAGLDDLPRNGAFVLGGMGNHGGSAADLVRALRVTKQAASQLIDTLVVRGYLTREIDEQDRRRTTLRLTERGQAAAEAIRRGVEEVDGRLVDAVGPSDLAAVRRGLTALVAIRDTLQSPSGD